MEPETTLSPEDDKLITLARSTRARTRAMRGAAVRDGDGRTYTASSVKLPSLELGALELAVAMAVSSGARSLEAGAVVTGREEAIVNLAVLRDAAGTGVPVYVCDERGVVVGVRHS